MDSWRIFCTGVGGQGTLMTTHLLGETALDSGLPVVVSEIHGMAQRGGVVESAVVMGNRRSPIISDNEADILLAFEPIEAMRALRKCHKDSLVITNTEPIIPFTVSTGKEKYPDIDKLMDLIRSQVKKLISFNALALAREAGSEISQNMIILGVLLKHGELPLNKDNVKEIIASRTKKGFKNINLKAFDLGYQLD